MQFVAFVNEEDVSLCKDVFSRVANKFHGSALFAFVVENGYVRIEQMRASRLHYSFLRNYAHVNKIPGIDRTFWY
jgi:hypothetical protein